MTGTAGNDDLIRIVLADANVLYSRVLRDYLLYAADQEIIAIAWSPEILAEVTEHLGQNVAGFDDAAAERLERAMNRAFPFAEIEPGEEHLRMLAEVALPGRGRPSRPCRGAGRRGNRAVHLEYEGLPGQHRQSLRHRRGHAGPTTQSACSRVRTANARRPPGGGRVAERRYRRVDRRRATPSRCCQDCRTDGSVARRRMSRPAGAHRPG